MGGRYPKTFEKSFASHPKSVHWHDEKNGDVKPRDEYKNSTKKCWFKCGDCAHAFDAALYHINSGSWCPYCANPPKKLCVEADCQACHEKSFASHPKSVHWHDEENGDVKPRDEFKNSTKKYWFKCGDCSHAFDAVLADVNSGQWCPFCANPPKKLCDDANCHTCHEKSFASHPKSVRWYDEKNGDVKPRGVFKNSNKKYWFKCGDCSHAFDTTLHNVNSGQWCPFCANPPKKLCVEADCQACHEKSFASHPKSVYWHDEKNGNVKPRDVFKNSTKKCWFKCGDCSHAFDATLNSINSGSWCPYCANPPKKLCVEADCQACHEKSFASHPKSVHWHDEENGDVKPRDEFKNSTKKYWFKCGDCTHAFGTALYNINSGQWCPFCANPPKKLCDDVDCQTCHEKSFASHPKSVHWHDEKNGKVKPRDKFKNSHTKRWFTCGDCTHAFDTTLQNVNSGKWCPACKHKTEKAVFECLKRAFGDETVTHLGTRNYVPKNDDDGAWHAFPYKFDIVVEHSSGTTTFIEVDGPQHFRDVTHWNSDAHEVQHRDLTKHIFALDRGCSVARIDQEWVARCIARGNREWETRLIDAVRAQKKCAFVCEDESKYRTHPCYWHGIVESCIAGLKTKKRRRFGVRVKRVKVSVALDVRRRLRRPVRGSKQSRRRATTPREP